MRHVYYGWYVVAITVVIFAVLVGSIYSAFGVFVLPVSAELRLSRAEMNTAIGLVSFGNAVMAPIVGWLLDRVAAKSVMVVGAIVYGLSMVTLGLSHSLWLSALVLALGLPVAYLGAGSLSATLLIARWFVAQRGRAMLLTGMGLYRESNWRTGSRALSRNQRLAHRVGDDRCRDGRAPTDPHSDRTRAARSE